VTRAVLGHCFLLAALCAGASAHGRRAADALRGDALSPLEARRCVGSGVYFTPTEAQLRDLEGRLPQAMAQLAGADAKRLLSMRGPRWYVGRTREGRDVITLYQRSIGGARERCPPVYGDDNHLWSIEFDPARGTFTRFSGDY
jgi:hypothetical protein